MNRAGIGAPFHISRTSPRGSALGPLLFLAAAAASTGAMGRAFTVADEIGLTLFDNPGGRFGPAVQLSPDGNYFLVWSERGRLDSNRVEDSLRFYRRQDIEAFLRHPGASQPPSPAWEVVRYDTEGPVINDCRWLADSSGVAFLDGGQELGHQRLVLADLKKKAIEPLTPATAVVGTFDVRDREHYVYTAFDQAERDALRQKKERADAQVTAIVVGAEHSFLQLLLPDDQRVIAAVSQPAKYVLWAVINGKRLEVKQDAAPVAPEVEALRPADLALSPDGSSVVTTLPVREVPSSWKTLYPPPSESPLYPYRIREGHNEPPHQYVRIDAKTGSIQSLTDAPIALDAGWNGIGPPSWSSDGQAVLLPNTFLKSKDHMPSVPCVAVVDLTSGTHTCVEMLERDTDKDYQMVTGAIFAGGSRERVIVSAIQNGHSQTVEYQHSKDGLWRLAGESKNEPRKDNNETLDVVVKEGLDEPPLLAARNQKESRVLWDPNPQLKDLQLGHASVYSWKDKEGRELKGGLYRPADYKPGQRYPLVIQTHGFRQAEFIPSGFLATGGAARSFAAAGILVLQVGERCPLYTPGEGPCAVSVYESAANRLISEGLVDPERIGIIGFSRTGFYVMATLTSSPVRFQAALIADSNTGTYLEDVVSSDLSGAVRQHAGLIGASPFGEGLQTWLQRSPGFNLDKITAALLVVPAGRLSLLTMWEPYAGLRSLQRPVDLIMLNSTEHLVTNPATRMASQGGSVDWFRFWLQGYEDQDPAKSAQYRRWRGLCDLQVAANPNRTTFCVASKRED